LLWSLALLLICFRGMRGKRALLLDCLGGRALRRVRLGVVLLLEHGALTLLRLLLELLLACLVLPLLLVLLVLLEAHLFLELLLAHLFLPLLELLLGLLLLTLLTVTVCFFLQSTPLGPTLHAEFLG